MSRGLLKGNPAEKIQFWDQVMTSGPYTTELDRQAKSCIVSIRYPKQGVMGVSNLIKSWQMSLENSCPTRITTTARGNSFIATYTKEGS